MAHAHLDRGPGEAALNAASAQVSDLEPPRGSQDAEAWIARCTRHLMALNPDSSLDGTDWDDIAGELFECLHRLPPEWAASTYVALNEE